MSYTEDLTFFSVSMFLKTDLTSCIDIPWAIHDACNMIMSLLDFGKVLYMTNKRIITLTIS